jgi:acetolactate decarboxylase
MFTFSCQKISSIHIDTSKAPKIQVIDTDFSKGQLKHVQSIHLDDLVKLHGHLCDGLVVGYLGLNQAFKELYRNGIINRTNTRIISKSSPCLADAGIYLTGGRYQYNSFYIDVDMSSIYKLQRLDNNTSVSVKLKEGIKPKEIDSLGRLAVQGRLDLETISDLKDLEDELTIFLLETSPKEVFEIEYLSEFQWHPNLKNDYLKTDILNKNLGE